MYRTLKKRKYTNLNKESSLLVKDVINYCKHAEWIKRNKMQKRIAKLKVKCKTRIMYRIEALLLTHNLVLECVTE